MTELAPELTEDELLKKAQEVNDAIHSTTAERSKGATPGELLMQPPGLREETPGSGGSQGGPGNQSGPGGQGGPGKQSGPGGYTWRGPGGTIDENGQVKRLPSLGPSYFINLACRWGGRVTGSKEDFSLSADEAGDLDLGWQLIREKNGKSSFDYAPEVAFILLILAIYGYRFWPQIWDAIEGIWLAKSKSDIRSPGNGQNLSSQVVPIRPETTI